jgi:hypothetical protein
MIGNGFVRDPAPRCPPGPRTPQPGVGVSTPVVTQRRSGKVVLRVSGGQLLTVFSGSGWATAHPTRARMPPDRIASHIGGRSVPKIGRFTSASSKVRSSAALLLDVLVMKLRICSLNPSRRPANPSSQGLSRDVRSSPVRWARMELSKRPASNRLMIPLPSRSPARGRPPLTPRRGCVLRSCLEPIGSGPARLPNVGPGPSGHLPNRCADRETDPRRRSPRRAGDSAYSRLIGIPGPRRGLTPPGDRDRSGRPGRRLVSWFSVPAGARHERSSDRVSRA